MFSEQYSLPTLTAVLIAAAERRRPGLGAWTPEARSQLRAVFETELLGMRKRFLELFDDRAYWDKVERTLLEVAFSRYLVLAEKQTQLERSGYGLWRGSDLVARGTYAAVGLVLGILMVEIPYVPITEKAFAFGTMLAAPFLPELQIWLLKRKFRKGLRAILADMHDAEEQLKLYQPLLEGSAQSPIDPLATGESPSAVALPGKKEPTKH